jgi:hypothetical protein
MLVKGRKFIPIETVDTLVDSKGMMKNSALAFFTVGVVVSMSKPTVS